MKKNRIIFTLFLIVCVLHVVSCNKGQQALLDNPPAAAGGCLYNCKSNQSDFPSEVTLYQVEYWNSTKYELEKDLVKETITDYKIYAEGPQTIAEYKGYPEYLNFYDGGKAFFQKEVTSINGGFSYFCDYNKQWYLEYSKPSLKWDLCNEISGEPSDPQNNDSLGHEDLSFHSMEDTEKKVLDQFDKWDLNMRVLEGYTINVSPEKNCYLLMFMEMIDQIPFMPYFYTEGDTKYTNWMLNPDAWAYISEDGVIDMRLMGLVQPSQKLESVKIISLDEAKENLEDHVKTKYMSNVTVEDMGLYYIGMPGTQQDEYVLTPFWFFCVSVEKSTQKAEGNPETTTEYYYELLNATNGEWLYH